ncbi:MAG: bifunctional pyr operon transcriptional regulator/uracil phosphoribosyltransferase PyrR [Bacteroidetes bacterium]|nr:bifunctional pyr operon transcriptional regulator/uracil phosphoribosyltransferase PyrR [Bacteroidota bacterium]MDA0902726.1 bifunctional pyr operon transcriptional regulator/uracil phosphoribosyltransferase PyrR [Bacteroidota bacterium]MDA1241807.1 bifunctional pyr operon transcriptional regulator/uracil phosphoribosyltransferase PyrR [Bacteroidota bacterium]
MDDQVLIPSEQFELILDRLAHQLIEHHDFAVTDLVGLQPRGSRLAERLQNRLTVLTGTPVRCGKLDVTFFRDDIRTHEKPLTPNVNDMGFTVEGRGVVLVDDVLFTGRTIRAGLDALLAHGRPSSVALAVLIDRRFSRELPIEPNYIGQHVDSIGAQHVKVCWKEEHGFDSVILLNAKPS